MYTDRIDVFDKAHRNHLIFTITHNLKLEFFPAEHGFFYQNLPDHTRSNTATGDHSKFVNVVNQAAACAAHGIRRTNNHRIPKLLRNLFCFFHTICGPALRHLNAQAVHCLLKLNTVLTALNRVELNPDDLDAVFFEYARLIQFKAQI